MNSCKKSKVVGINDEICMVRLNFSEEPLVINVISH